MLNNIITSCDNPYYLYNNIIIIYNTVDFPIHIKSNDWFRLKRGVVSLIISTVPQLNVIACACWAQEDTAYVGLGCKANM